MSDRRDKADDLIHFFREREKELECLYNIEELLVEPDAPREKVFRRIIETIPSGWQYPDICTRQDTDRIEELFDARLRRVPLGDERRYLRRGREGRRDQRLLLEGDARSPTKVPSSSRRSGSSRRSPTGSATSSCTSSCARRPRSAARSARARAPANGGSFSTSCTIPTATSSRTSPRRCSTISAGAASRKPSGCASTLVPVELDFEAGPDQEANKPYQLHSLEITDRLSDEIFRIAAKEYTDEQILALSPEMDPGRQAELPPAHRQPQPSALRGDRRAPAVPRHVSRGDRSLRRRRKKA